MKSPPAAESFACILRSSLVDSDLQSVVREQWLKENSVPGMYGVDTRALTKKLRIHGARR
jgi:carbamoylphosphate synthase small subunit